MKFSLKHIFFLFFVISCVQNNIVDEKIDISKKTFYSSTGFALIYNNNLYKENLFKPNYTNAAKGNFPPELDEIVIFPSKTQHSTITNETSNDRMSISGDISIISKNSENLETLLTPINKWKKF